MNIVLGALMFLHLGLPAQAEETNLFAQVTGASARSLFQALSPHLRRKDNRIEFQRVECTVSKDSHCEVNKKRILLKTKQGLAIKRALENLKTGTELSIASGFCTSERGHFYCSYDYVTR